MTTITVSGDPAYWNNHMLTGIDAIIFAPGGAAHPGFDDSQLESTVHVTGNGHDNLIEVLIDVSLGSLPGAFSAAGWTFSHWPHGSLVYIAGANGPDTIVGSSGCN